jgi:hypothetical protein
MLLNNNHQYVDDDNINNKCYLKTEVRLTFETTRVSKLSHEAGVPNMIYI